MFVIGAAEHQVILSNIMPFHWRPIGPQLPTIHSIRPLSHIFDKLMSYSSYRLKLALHTRTSLETTEVRIHIKNMTITMKKHMFSGSHPIHILHYVGLLTKRIPPR